MLINDLFVNKDMFYNIKFWVFFLYVIFDIYVKIWVGLYDKYILLVEMILEIYWFIRFMNIIKGYI